MTFRAPVNDIVFALEKIVGWDELMATGAFPDFSPDLAVAVLEEAAKFSEGTLAPLDAPGDREGSRLENGVVVTPAGFKEAYADYVAGGWMGISGAPDFGGQGLPHLLAAAVMEMTTAANMSFMLCPMLSHGAIEALEAHGTQTLKDLYLPRIMSGEWAATMNLTEPQAGSDVGALRTKAEPQRDGSYHITGTKIFITYGEQDMSENIVHLVLARLPGAPAGTRGISLFLVPKFVPDADGKPGVHNGVACASLEHKIGIHASPTCVMQFGEHAPAVGWLIGEENRGMACMFTMMNAARLAVGLQGVGAGTRAYDQALRFAQERRQGKAAGVEDANAPIIAHPDVARMLGVMRVTLTAMRALCYDTALSIDLSHAAPGDDARKAAKARAGLLTPLAKAWCTDQGIELASLNIQIHGGMGYVEETGAAQIWRDARIAPIYEGTNGIQAIDLVTRKIMADDGAAVSAFLDEIAATVAAAEGRDPHDHHHDDACGCGHDHGTHTGDPLLAPVAAMLGDALQGLNTVTAWMQAHVTQSPQDALAGATPYLDLFATVAGAHYLLRAALAVSDDPAQKEIKANEARFYASHMLARAFGLAAAAMAGADSAKAVIGAQID